MRKRLIAWIAGIAVLAATAQAQPSVPYPPQPSGVEWPREAWQVGTLPDDVRAALDTLLDTAMARAPGDEMGETRAIVVIHSGKLVAERYRDGFGPETRQVSWSMAKSITQALLGRAVESGVIDSIDAAMPSPWPDRDPRSRIAWRQWVEMTDGLDYTEIGATGLMTNDVVQMMYGPGRFDVVDYIRALPLAHEPGRHWNYSTAGFHLVSWALAQRIEAGAASGQTDARSLRAFAKAELFTPLGMDTVMEADAAGTVLGGSLVWASARDFAKFGYLYLRGGVWQGARFLPDGWVDWARTGALGDDGNVYGAGWWITPRSDPSHPGQVADAPPWDAFAATGHEGQVIWIVPSRDLVIVRLGLMGNDGGNWPALYDWCQAVARVFPET